MVKGLTSGTIYGWGEFSIIDKSSQDLRSQNTETTTVSFFIEKNKTLNKYKLSSICLNTEDTKLLVSYQQNPG